MSGRPGAPGGAAPGRTAAGVEQLFRGAADFHERGELQRAEHLYREVLRQQPHHAGALNMLGVIGCQSGQLRAGADLIRRAIELEPADAGFHNNLGMALLQDGAPGPAQAAFEEAVRLRPRFAEAQCNLANALVRNGQPERAEKHYQKALRAAPDYADALNNLGNLLRQQGRAADALKPLRRLLRRAPEFAGGHYNLGLALQATGAYAEAADALREAVRLEAGEVRFRVALADCLRLGGDLEAAEAAYLAAAEAGGQTPALLNAAGITRYALGRVDEAAACFEQARELEPDNPATLNHLGMVASARGDRDTASAHFRAAIDADAHFADAWRNLVESGPDESERPGLLTRVRELTANTTAQPDLFYALGALEDAAGNLDAAFEAWRRANAMQQQQARFNPGAQAAFIEALIDTFDSVYLSTRLDCASSSETPVFVVGMPRSGTTLVEQVLGSHPRCHAAGELTFFPANVPGLGRELERPRPFPACLPGNEERLLAALAPRYLELLATRGGDAARVLDKMPYNFLYLGLIALLFPRARVIHCRRDAMATCFSIYSKNLAGSHPYAYSLGDLGHAYRGYARLLRHWEAVLPLPLLTVDYETLVAEPERVTRELVDFAGLPWDAACLHPERNPRAVTTASQWQVRRPVYTTSVAAWRRYAQHLEPLRQALGAD